MSYDVTDAPLSEIDPEIAAVLDAEADRQRGTLEMIASENFAPRAVLQAQGSVLTNKYAEGYPGKRYYGGCEQVDVAEELARERAKQLFGAEHANVQPHSGASANAAVMQKLLTPGDTILGLDLAHGGHLTHGMRLNFSGMLYDAATYGVSEADHRIDMDQVRSVALERRPKMIIAGWSAYPRHLDFAAFRAIADEVGAYLLVDMAHFAGLVAAGVHPSPVPYAHVVTSTTHKTLTGPRAGIILCTADLAKKIDSGVFPGQQGGPLMHVIAAKAVAFKLAMTPEFKEKQERTLRGASILADRLLADDARATGVDVVTGGTDVHMVLADLRSSTLDGKQAEDRLDAAGITANRNAVPFDPRPPMVTSGVRLGTPALATRGFGDAEFTEVADIVAGAFDPASDTAALRERVAVLTEKFPLYTSVGRDRVSARLLDGKATAAAIRRELTERVSVLRERGVVPGLGTLLVGEDPGSASYVAGKHRDCAEVGITSVREDLPAEATQADVLAAVARLNDDPTCTGYIVQLPLPAGLDQQAVLEAVDPDKDADGLHPTNLGRLVLQVSGDITSPLPCTPRGIVELLGRYDVPLTGADVVVVGRGVTVGRHLGLLLTRKGIDATVTLTHTRTRDLAAVVRRADVVVAAAGAAGMIRPDWVKPGAAVLDVGVTRVLDEATGRSRLVGDVDPDVAEVAGWLAPMPGGVGPMTRAMLLANVVDSAERALA